MLSALGRFMYRARWAVVLVWAVLFGVSAYFAPRVLDVLSGGGYTVGSSDSSAAFAALHTTSGYRSLAFVVVFKAPPQAEAQLPAVAEAFRVRAEQRYARLLLVRPPVFTPDHRVAFLRVYSGPQSDLGASITKRIQELFPRGQITGYVTGGAAVLHDMEAVSNDDLHRIEIITLPIALVILLLIFGSVVASAIPVLIAPISVTMALAIIWEIGRHIDMSIFVFETASMVGLGVAIDYSLLMVNRFREELERGEDVKTAVGNTVSTAGRAILVSAIVVSIGFYGLAFSGVDMLRSLGLGGSIVTILSLLLALSLLPAVLGIVGARVNSLRVVPQRLSTRQAWHRLAHWVMRRPVPIIVVVSAVIIVLAIPAFHIRVGVPGPELLPPSIQSRAGNDILDTELGYANHSPVLVVLVRDRNNFLPMSPAQTTSVFRTVCAPRKVYGTSRSATPRSESHITPCSTIRELIAAGRFTRDPSLGLKEHGGVAVLPVFIKPDASSAKAEMYVSHLRQKLKVPGYRVLIGGQTAAQMDFDSYLYGRFPLVILFVVVTILAVLFLAFRSVLLPIKAVLMNMFSVLATYGALVWAFQDGHLSRLFGFTVVGNVSTIVPVFLFAVLFGLSTDYEVFLLTRVQEEYLASGNNEDSVATGLEVTGRIITSAAVVMIVVFGAFSFARLIVVQEIGFGLAVAVLVDATLIRALLVPATMRLLGRWNWWLPFRGFPRPRPRPTLAPGPTPGAE